MNMLYLINRIVATD